MLRRTFFRALCSFAFLIPAAFVSGQSNIDLTITKEAGQPTVPVYRVAITSENPEFARLARRAFETHGSYRVTTPDKAQFTFNFSPTAGNAVKVSIKGGSVYEQVCTGPNETAALMKACDVAVARTLKTPGYFAGTLAFSYSRNGLKTTEICVSDMVFKNVRAITSDNSDSIFPHFSPDGTKIIYTGYFRTGFMDLFLIDLATNSRKVFASFKGSNTGGAFSPDGTKVASVLTSSGNAEVWVSNSQGQGFRKMTNTPSTESSASFSPDGSKLIFASDVRGGPQIYTMPASGGKMQVVRTNISNYCSEPVWNPRYPNLIAFTAAIGKGFQIMVYDFNTKQTRQVSRGESTSNPKWLNDGRHIVATKSRGNSRQLYVIDSETDSQKPLHTTSFGSVKEPDYVYAPR